MQNRGSAAILHRTQKGRELAEFATFFMFILSDYFVPVTLSFLISQVSASVADEP